MVNTQAAGPLHLYRKTGTLKRVLSNKSKFCKTAVSEYKELDVNVQVLPTYVDADPTQAL